MDHATNSLSIPNVVSKRNHFESVGTLVEDHWSRVPTELKTEDLRNFLLDYTSWIIRDVSHAFQVGAERGIEQTAHLLRDPAYYDTLRERRRRNRQHFEEYGRQQKQEQLERRLAPTPEQIERDEELCHQCIADSEQAIVRCRERLAYLATLKNRPKHVRINSRQKAE